MSQPVDQPDYSTPAIHPGGEDQTAVVAVAAGATEDVFTITGFGQLNYIVMWFQTPTAAPIPTGDIHFRWVVDGVEQYETNLDEVLLLVNNVINTPTDFLFTGINIVHVTDQVWILHSRIPIKFRSSLTLRARNSHGAIGFGVYVRRWAEVLGL